MSRLATAAVVAGHVFLLACEESPDNAIPDSAEAAIAEIRSAEERHRIGYQTLDTTVIGELLAPDYTTSARGRGEFRDRAHAIQAILDHDPLRPIVSIERWIDDIRVYDNVAVVTATSRLTTSNRRFDPPRPQSSRGAYTHVWVRSDDGAWRLASRHGHRIDDR